MKPERMNQLDAIHMRAARDYATMSHALRKKTGAVITIGDTILSYGWNGMPAGSSDDCCELKDANGDFILNDEGELITNPMVLHAEANGILKMARLGGLGCTGATLFCTLSPCIECSKLILQSKIARVVYDEPYRILDGVNILRSYGVNVEQFYERS